MLCQIAGCPNAFHHQEINPTFKTGSFCVRKLPVAINNRFLALTIIHSSNADWQTVCPTVWFFWRWPLENLQGNKTLDLPSLPSWEKDFRFWTPLKQEWHCQKAAPLQWHYVSVNPGSPDGVCHFSLKPERWCEKPQLQMNVSNESNNLSWGGSPCYRDAINVSLMCRSGISQSQRRLWFPLLLMLLCELCSKNLKNSAWGGNQT